MKLEATAIINRKEKFSTFCGVILKTEIVCHLVQQVIEMEKATKVIDTEETIMYNLKDIIFSKHTNQVHQIKIIE